MSVKLTKNGLKKHKIKFVSLVRNYKIPIFAKKILI